MTAVIILSILIFGIAMLYSSVGHAGASGYLAAMAIVGSLAQEEMKLIALLLNVFVGTIGSIRFYKAGHFHWATFWPFAVAAMPMSYLGGSWNLPAAVFKPLIGLVLLFASVMLIWKTRREISAAAVSEYSELVDHTTKQLPLAVALITGAVLGLLAGLTGTGGGIFLSPLLLLCGWAAPKRTAAVSVVFVLLNSLAGLGGVITTIDQLPHAELPWFVIAAVSGGLIGSNIGARKQTTGHVIRLLLAVVLMIAAGKMLLTGW